MPASPHPLAPRVRQHVNPLARRYQVPPTPPEWESVYADWSLPLGLDIGCGRGSYLWQKAQERPDWNWLGLEIREPLVQWAIARQQQAGLRNLHYLFCNANVVLPTLLPPGKLHRVSIQFPDPWFKRKQQKRRVTQPELVGAIARLMVPGGQVLLQSDVREVAREMVAYFDADPHFENVAGAGNFIAAAAYPETVQTEREIATLLRGEPVYRACFVRGSSPGEP